MLIVETRWRDVNARSVRFNLHSLDNNTSSPDPSPGRKGGKKEEGLVAPLKQTHLICYWNCYFSLAFSATPERLSGVRLSISVPYGKGHR